MSERVLVVEDEKEIARILERNLRYEGYRVEVVSEGETALRRIYDDPPALVLLDLTLPDVDGL
ncbi:MAG: response regulator, partial [bacterium]